MKQQEIEELLIRSLDIPLTAQENEKLTLAIKENALLVKQLEDHKKIREQLHRDIPKSFGPFFAARVTTHIENTGVIIERQIFIFFKKYQLLAAGVIVGLLILNSVFAEKTDINSTFGLENTTTTDTNTPAAEEIVSFDFYKTLNNDL